MSNRLPFTIFGLPVPEIRRGYYSALYFCREQMILEKEGNVKEGLMQVFNKVDGATTCGIDEALAILRVGTGHWRDHEKMYPLFDRYLELKGQRRFASAKSDWEKAQEISAEMCQIQKELDGLWVDTHAALKVHALYDGEQSPAFDAVMTIEGQGSEFAHLESLYLGVLARGTRVATNTRRVVEAANGKPILFFADRFDRWQNQVADGYAALKSGVFGVASDAMGQWWGVSGLGTTPHALIAFYEGDTAAATLAFTKHYPNVNAVALVDFHNDCVKTSLEVTLAFAKNNCKLWGVRLDTSGTLVDQSVIPTMEQFPPTGVCVPLVENVRRALDRENFKEVKIVVSGGFNPQKIAGFEKAGAPVDAYGVGSSLLQGNFDHTADIVLVEGQPMAKVGRRYRPGKDLKPVSWDEIEPF